MAEATQQAGCTETPLQRVHRPQDQSGPAKQSRYYAHSDGGSPDGENGDRSNWLKHNWRRHLVLLAKSPPTRGRGLKRNQRTCR